MVHCWNVSILVLLEVPLRPCPRIESRGFVRGFQSLFCWKFLLGTSDQNEKLRFENEFQSLFCWKFLLGFNSALSSAISCRFQSLFCWKFLLGQILKIYTLLYETVSILVLLEVPLRHRFNNFVAIIFTQFQSLFCWKFLLGIKVIENSFKNLKSFNPCFAGSSS